MSKLNWTPSKTMLRDRKFWSVGKLATIWLRDTGGGMEYYKIFIGGKLKEGDWDFDTVSLEDMKLMVEAKLLEKYKDLAILFK